jgi:hypothetical protein
MLQKGGGGCTARSNTTTHPYSQPYHCKCSYFQHVCVCVRARVCSACFHRTPQSNTWQEHPAPSMCVCAPATAPQDKEGVPSRPDQLPAAAQVHLTCSKEVPHTVRQPSWYPACTTHRTQALTPSGHATRNDPVTPKENQKTSRHRRREPPQLPDRPHTPARRVLSTAKHTCTQGHQCPLGHLSSHRGHLPHPPCTLHPQTHIPTHIPDPACTTQQGERVARRATANGVCCVHIATHISRSCCHPCAHMGLAAIRVAISQGTQPGAVHFPHGHIAKIAIDRQGPDNPLQKQHITPPSMCHYPR